MKRTFLLSFTLTVATVSVLADEDVVERVAKSVYMTKDEINQTSVTEEDLMKFDTKVIGDLQITDPNNTAFKVGCLFACLAKKRELMTGTLMEVDKIKKVILSSPIRQGRHEDLDKFDQLLSSCARQVEGKTNECEVAYVWVKCMI